MGTQKHGAGFTLIETAIVIAIVALVLGSIFIGKDVIKAALLRATIHDIGQLNRAVSTFRAKYAGLPGDLAPARAVAFDFPAEGEGRNGRAGRGDGNGRIEGCTANATALGCETALFWVDLSAADLIPPRLSTYTASSAFVANATTPSRVADYLPKQKLRDTVFLHAYPHRGQNYFFLGSATAVTDGMLALDNGATSEEAYALDTKFDDSQPTHGDVQAITALGVVDTGKRTGEDRCVDATVSPARYELAEPTLTHVNCMLQLRATYGGTG